MNRGSKRASGVGSPVAASCARAEPAQAAVALTATATRVAVDQRKHSLCIGVVYPRGRGRVTEKFESGMAQAAVLPSLAPTFPLTGRGWIGYCIMFHDIRRFSGVSVWIW